MDIGKELPAIFVKPITRPASPKPPTTPAPREVPATPEREKVTV